MTPDRQSAGAVRQIPQIALNSNEWESIARTEIEP